MDILKQAEDMENVSIVKDELDLGVDTIDDVPEMEKEETPGKPHEEKQNETGQTMRDMCRTDRCNLSCGKRLISEEQRLAISNHFWQLPNDEERSVFISRNIDPREPKTNTPEALKRKVRHRFFEIEGQRIRVCRRMFEATLNISPNWFHSIKKTSSGGEKVEDDEENEKKRFPESAMREICSYKSCRLFCGNRLISEEQRRQIHDHFWKIPLVRDRWVYINNHVSLNKSKVTKCTPESNRRKYHNLEYFFKIDGVKKKVCRTTFAGTLGISSEMAYFAVKKINELGIDSLVKRKSYDHLRDMPEFVFIDTDSTEAPAI